MIPAAALFDLRRARSPLLALAVVCASPLAARAAGFELLDNGTRSLSRGGAFSALADDGSAVALNPGALTRATGTRLYLSNDFYHAPVTFTRDATSIPVGVLPPGTDAETATRPSENKKPWFPIGPMLVLGSDLGLDDWQFAFSFYGPASIGRHRYDIDAGSRWMLTRMDLSVAYVGASVAWGKSDHYGVGVTLQNAMALDVKFRQVTDGANAGPLHPYYGPVDLETEVRLHDYFAPTAIVGAWYRPVERFEVSLSGRVIPVYFHTTGDVRLHNVPGITVFTPEELAVDDSSASLDLVLPPTAHLGLRYRHPDGQGGELFDVELDVVYEAWSMFKRYDVKLGGTLNVIVVGQEVPDIDLEKRWRDTLSLRLGGSWNVIRDRLSLSLGGFWESGAVPNRYEALDFLSFSRFGVAFGARLTVGRFELGAAYAHVFQEDRHTDEAHGQLYQIRPLDPCPESCDSGAGWSGVPANAGRFESRFDILSASVGVAF
ncbi:MAG: outer membrane protein transport protein [Deltaproteobacteria bacterium]|nr:outer membrane protein transport protein [Deltaproteobacteria bacterium]MCB9787569.1 outer membrane protein transport protein [Deltaproteobacteria bacterium]